MQHFKTHVNRGVRIDSGDLLKWSRTLKNVTTL